MSGLFQRPVEDQVAEPVAAPEATKGLMQRQLTEDYIATQALLKALTEYKAGGSYDP
jgi:hypothetical protein